MAAPVATRSFVGCKTHGAPANDACTSCQAAIDKSVTEQVLASTQEATGEAAVCATCGGKRYVQERDPAVMPAWTYETAGYRRPCPDCTPRTETQDSAVEEAREAVMRSWGMMNRLYEEHAEGRPYEIRAIAASPQEGGEA
jgi:DNA-directed RNA polymerase subunit RPC12/RpoP